MYIRALAFNYFVLFDSCDFCFTFEFTFLPYIYIYIELCIILYTHTVLDPWKM